MSQSTFLERLRMLYKIIGLLVVFAAILVAFASLPELYRRMRNAKDTNERNFFALELAGTWCFIYPVTMFVVFAVASDRLQEVWPTISWILFDWDMPHQKSVMIDIALSIFLCPTLLVARYLFGSSDVDGTYRNLTGTPGSCWFQSHLTLIERYSARNIDVHDVFQVRPTPALAAVASLRKSERILESKKEAAPNTQSQ